MTARPDLNIDQLSRALEDAAESISPSVVPLDVITSQGRRYRRQRVVLGGVAVGTGAALVAVAALNGLGTSSMGTRGDRAAAATQVSVVPSVEHHGDQTAPSQVRLLPLGKKFSPRTGTAMWLIENGARWTTPGSTDPDELTLNDRRVDQKTRDSIWEGKYSNFGGSNPNDESDWRGLYYGPGMQRAARAVVTTREGKHYAAHLVTTPDRPAWGAWYAEVPADARDIPQNLDKSEVTAITIYDSEGKALVVSEGIVVTPPSKS